MALAALPLKLPEVYSVVGSVEPSELSGLLAEGSATVVDVRSAEERADGYVVGSIHVPSDRWDRWQTAPGQSPVQRELQSDVTGLLATAVADDKLIVFHCMYSKERAPRAAQAAADVEPAARVAVLRGGFQRLMAQHWQEGQESNGELEVGADTTVRVFESVRSEQWVPNGRQGLVWKPDLDPLHLDDEPEPEEQPAA